MRTILFLIAAFVGTISHALIIKDQQVTLEKLEDYKTCQTRDGGGKFCQEALDRWVEQHPDDAFTAGKLTRLHMNHWAAIPYFAKAKDSKTFDCQDQDLKYAIQSASDLPDSAQNQIKTQAMELKKMCKERKKK